MIIAIWGCGGVGKTTIADASNDVTIQADGKRACQLEGTWVSHRIDDTEFNVKVTENRSFGIEYQTP